MHDRMWVGVGRYPGKRLILFGTVVAPERREAVRKLNEAWEACFPYAPPDFEPAPGQLIFREGEPDG